jgi:hypothetical protein
MRLAVGDRSTGRQAAQLLATPGVVSATPHPGRAAVVPTPPGCDSAATPTAPALVPSPSPLPAPVPPADGGGTSPGGEHAAERPSRPSHHGLPGGVVGNGQGNGEGRVPSTRRGQPFSRSRPARSRRRPNARVDTESARPVTTPLGGTRSGCGAAVLGEHRWAPSTGAFSALMAIDQTMGPTPRAGGLSLCRFREVAAGTGPDPDSPGEENPRGNHRKQLTVDCRFLA